MGPAEPGSGGTLAAFWSGGPSSASSPATGGTPAGGRAGRYDGGPDLAGTVYGGGEGAGFTTVALPSAVETSGSLTGHILAQGWAETPAAERSRTARVVIVLAAALGLLVLISVLLVLLAGDAVSGLINNVLST
ncbi:hypothetical protein D7193_09960 [Micromonospora costi]|uniref:Uncharacterized protein n=1 Tax=Micromonospora costi TaxID=1530042 RepID=A0A3B0AE35_9ACTN|nr:hypothetical protein D7193_09960 [Micromonospora costi]